MLTLLAVLCAALSGDSLTPIPGPTSPDAILEGKGHAAVKALVESKVKAAARLPVPSSPAEFDHRRAAQKTELMRALGLDPLPRRTPLNAHTTPAFKRDGYRVERLILESRPAFPVTALIYIPDTPADAPEGFKFPVIVNPHGHWAHKKSEPVVQMRAISQALSGYIAVVIDSPGHSFEGDTPIERRWAGAHDDLALTMSVGSATGIYVWDLMRTVDYLQTRPDADTTRIGITGASGGGLAALYAFAADDRFTAAVPVCYASSMEVNPHNGCLCNHVPAALRLGDRADVLAIRAPAPVLIIGASNDGEFPPAGTTRTAEKLKALYTLVNAADRTSSLIVDSGHDYNKPMREAAMGFFNKHLKGIGDGSPAPEPAIMPEPADSKDLVCIPIPPGDLKTMRGAAAQQLAQPSPRTFEEVCELNGGLPTADPASLPRILDQSPADSHRKLIIYTSENGLEIPGILLLPQTAPSSIVILLFETGKLAASADFNTKALLNANIACFCIDVRGVGELTGLDERLMTYLGTAPAFAMGFDARSAAPALRFLAKDLNLPPNIPIGIAARGPTASQAAMFAALMAPTEIAYLAALDSLREHADCFRKGIPRSAIQPRAALSASLPHLRSLIKQPARWHFLDEAPPDPAAIIIEAARP